MYQPYSAYRLLLIASISVSLLMGSASSARAEIKQADVLTSINQGTQYLFSQQQTNGSWSSVLGVGSARDPNGIATSSLVILTLLNAGVGTEEPHVKRGLNWIRNEPDPNMTYAASLKLMALAAAKQPQKDLTRIQILTSELESWQTGSGMWDYGGPTNGVAVEFKGGGDNSNTQFALLALRDAVHAGAKVDRKTWENSLNHWEKTQNNDGGWNYARSFGRREGGGGSSYGSMTVAGISSYVISRSMIRTEDKLKADGTPDCCGTEQLEDPLEKAKGWMARHFSVGTNPGIRSKGYLLYYLYGMERAGRLSGTRFFGQHDWYREGAEFLIGRQSKFDGSWRANAIEGNSVLGTCFGLLFLSKGMSPILFNKLKYGRPDPINPQLMESQSWNRHTNDIRNLTDWITGLPKWPKLMSWQVVDLNKAARNKSVDDLLQAPILYISGDQPIDLPQNQVKLLRHFLDQGGIIFAAPSCDPQMFEPSFKILVSQIYEEEEASLKPLTAEHPVYRSEFLLHPDSVNLQGVDFGCRTTIIYCPDDLGCLWEHWSRNPPKNRTSKVTTMVTRATYIGANVAAYATGRKPPKKQIDPIALDTESNEQKIERGLLQIGKLKHTGNWDTAPLALQNLLLALNETAGMTANTESPALAIQDKQLERYPILYMHGRTPFELPPEEIARLRKYLDYGGFLFADACCGSEQFDESFRLMVKQLYPNQKIKRIPPDHPLFTDQVGHNIQKVRRRQTVAGKTAVLSNAGIIMGEPVLESIEIEGRFPIIYSKYDISCALQKQSSVSCAGYLPEDATRIGVNVILYALMQDFTFVESPTDSK